MRCACTGVDSDARARTGCFPATDGIQRVILSPPRCSGRPVRRQPNARALSTGTSILTPCVIALPRICWKPGPTCALSRCCLDIAIWKRRRSTSTSHLGISAQPPVHGCAHPANTGRTDTQPIDRPPLEMADIVRCAGPSFVERSRRWITWQHQKVLLAITRCRTAALGGHRDRCSDCGHTTAISYNSCRNRHCPRCQANARLRWLQAREQELLPTRYVHLVFTLPRELAPLALQNKRVIYNLLFQASAATLLEIARDPRHLGAEIGFFSVLHTWNQRLQHHPHVHCVAAAGGLAPDHTRWVSSQHSFFLPVKVLSRVFRGKFVAGLRAAFLQGKLEFYAHLAPLAEQRLFAAWLRSLFRHDWVVYAKPPFGGPEHALRYLSGYTHRVAISNRRLVALEQGNVTFRWRDSAHGNKKRLLTLPIDEFL